jgi:hypothetical protein
MQIPHGHCTHSRCMWNSPRTHPARTPQTCHTHVTNLSYTGCTCTAYLPLAYIGSTLSTCTHSWMPRHIVLHARMPQAQCTYSGCTHDVCMVHTRNTQAAHMPYSPASQMAHMSHTQVCCRHAKGTHCVHIECKPHATHACMHATLILHILHAH